MLTAVWTHLNTPVWRAAAGVALAGAVAGGARRTRSLSPSGMWAAIVVGTASVAGGWSWGVLLVVFFVASTALSHWGDAQKQALTSTIVAKGGTRDATQVLANGGLFALCALGALCWPAFAATYQVLGAGALAAAAADTWATEIGTLFGRTPRAITTLKPVAPGTSGGVTVAGTAAALVGAAFVALLALVAQWGCPTSTFGSEPVACGPVGATSGWILTASVTVGGFIGALTDSLLGATLQARRYCAQCEMSTERTRHHCGELTTAAGGVAWLDNDAVNAVCTAVGAMVSLGTLSLLYHGR